jgi:PASTA domain
MTTDEQRLAQLLKTVVPEPPVQLSADQITTGRAPRPTARAWAVPALAAAAVAAIGVAVGLVAAQQPGAGRGPSPASQSSGSASAVPTGSVSCAGRTVTVPNVVGETSDAGIATLHGADLNAEPYYATDTRVPQGTILAQSLAGGSTAVPGAMVVLEIATAPPGLGMNFSPTVPPTPPSACEGVTPVPPNDTQPVPNVVGMTVAHAKEVVEAEGFSVSTVTVTADPPTSHSVPPGTVFAQGPAAGSQATPRSGIILYVAPAS